MAKFNVVGLDDFIGVLSQRTDKVIKKIPKMLEAGAAVLVEAQKTQIEIDDLIDTRAMRDSIKAGKVKKDKSYGINYVEIAPSGKDKQGVRNAEKGFIYEYGTSDLQATHWMSKANAKAEQAMYEAEAAVWEADDDGE